VKTLCIIPASTLLQGVALFILMLIVSSSCSKEKTIIFNEAKLKGKKEIEFRDGSFDLSECSSIKSAVTMSGGMLIFQDMEHFEKCALCLEHDYNVHNDQYEAQYPNASQEELDSFDIINNFNQWETYLQFENGLGIASLRAKLEADTDQWLASTPADSIDFANNPDDSVPIFWSPLRAMFNEDGYAIVGYDTDDWEERSFWGDCAFFATSSKDYFFSDRRINMKISVMSGLIASKLFGEIRHYKKVNNKYRLTRARLRIDVGGNSFDSECEEKLQLWTNFTTYKNRSSLQIGDIIWVLWREALVDKEHADWPGKACVAHGFWESDNNWFPVILGQ
jgi:hypothetical protein